MLPRRQTPGRKQFRYDQRGQPSPPDVRRAWACTESWNWWHCPSGRFNETLKAIPSQVCSKHFSVSFSILYKINYVSLQLKSFKKSHPKSGMSMPLAARSVTRSTLDFLAANLAALIFLAAESGTWVTNMCTLSFYTRRDVTCVYINVVICVIHC